MKFSDLKHGDKIVADGGFACLQKGEVCKVVDGGHGKFVRCQFGHHYLVGQTQTLDGEMIGFTYEAVSPVVSIVNTELENMLDDEDIMRREYAAVAETRLILEGRRLLTAVAAHMDGYKLQVTNVAWERDRIIEEARRLAGGRDLKRIAALLHEAGAYLSGTSGNQDLQVDRHRFWEEVRDRCQWDHHADRYWISGKLNMFVYLTGGEEPW